MPMVVAYYSKKSFFYNDGLHIDPMNICTIVWQMSNWMLKLPWLHYICEGSNVLDTKDDTLTLDMPILTTLEQPQSSMLVM